MGIQSHSGRSVGIYSGYAEASFAFLSGGSSHQQFRNYSNNYPNEFYNEISDKTVLFGFNAYLFLGASLQLSLDVEGFLAEIERILWS